MLTYEPAEQDGCSFVAIEAWPADREPHRAEPGTSGDSYRSRTTITFDDPEAPGPA